jgi:alkylated DNA repair protein alkB homolog 6
VNEYAPDGGILPHTDGPRYIPRVATLSLGEASLMEFRRCGASTGVEGALLLRPRSLVITTEELYSDWMHSIAAEEEIVVGGEGAPPVWNAAAIGLREGEARAVRRAATRVSFTFRHVPPPA